MILHLVTDRRRLTSDRLDRPADSDRDSLAERCAWAIAAGVDVIQVRERDLEAAALCHLVQRIVRAACGSATKVVVNDRLDVALAAGADGVHLPARGLPVAAVRGTVPRGFLVGRSVHDARELADAAGADYVIAGTVWPTPSKPGGHPCLGPDGLRALRRQATMPVLAIGGVTGERLPVVREAGVAGVAAIGLFTAPADSSAMALAVSAMRTWFDTPGTAS